MKRMFVGAVALTIAGLLATAGGSTAQTGEPTLTLGPHCQQNSQWFDYGVVITVAGLAPGTTVLGSLQAPDGFAISGSLSADASGIATITVADRLPGVFTVKIAAPFVATKHVYFDCGRPLPTRKADCRKGGWVRYGFKNKRRCFKFVRQMSRCVTLFYGPGEPAWCPPKLPNE
jgi:hypothetical protein